MPHSEHLIHRNIAQKKKASLFDKVVVIASVIYPLSALPQAFEVFSGNTEGVSLYSWISFLICAILFFIYGCKHKVLPMIIANSLWIMTDSAVIFGLLVDN